MNSSAVENPNAFAKRVAVTDDTVAVDLADGRTIAVPLAWYPRLANSTQKERDSWRLIAGGLGIHWPEIDEDISVGNLLAGQRSGESQNSLSKWLATRTRKSRGRRQTAR